MGCKAEMGPRSVSRINSKCSLEFPCAMSAKLEVHEDRFKGRNIPCRCLCMSADLLTGDAAQFN